MATGYQRLQAALAEIQAAQDQADDAEALELPTLAREYDPETADSDLIRYIPERGKPARNVANFLAAQLGVATPRMWRERERDMEVEEEGWQANIASAARVFGGDLETVGRYASTDIDRAQIEGISAKFAEGLEAARSDNPFTRQFGGRLMAEAQAQLAPWLGDIEKRREVLIDGELRHLETMYRDGEKDLGIVEGVRDAAVLRSGQFAAKWNTVDFDDEVLTERQRKALALDEIGYMAQAPDMIDGILRGVQNMSGVAAGAAMAAPHPAARAGLAIAAALASGASNIRGIADDFTADQLRAIIDAGYGETVRQSGSRIEQQYQRLNELELRRAELSQLAPIVREPLQPAEATTSGPGRSPRPDRPPEPGPGALESMLTPEGMSRAGAGVAEAIAAPPTGARRVGEALAEPFTRPPRRPTRD